MNHFAGGNGFPLFAVDIDHLLTLARDHVQNLLSSRVIVPHVPFPRLQEHHTHGEAAGAGDTRFAEPLDCSPSKDLGFNGSGSYEAAAVRLSHGCSFADA